MTNNDDMTTEGNDTEKDKSQPEVTGKKEEKKAKSFMSLLGPSKNDKQQKDKKKSSSSSSASMTSPYIGLNNKMMT